MHELAPLIYDLAVMLGVAAIVVLIFQRIHQPVVLGYLVAGLIIGPNTPPYAFVTDVVNIQTLSELGVIFLMFSLGLEFSFKKLTRVGSSASITGLVEVFVMLAVGFSAGKIMGWQIYDCLFLGAALAISSTTIIIKAIDELKLKSKRFAELVFGVLIVEDLLAIILLVALSTFVVTNNVLSFDMLNAVIKLVLVVGCWFLVGYFFVPTVFRSIAKYISQETLTITAIALCLFLVTVAAYFHYSTALGAFIMGSILAETTLIDDIHEVIVPIRDIFAAVFFISVGMLIDPVIIMQEWKAVFLISVITISGKLLSTSVGAFLSGQSLTTSIRAGFSMAQIGEFSFIIVALGVSLQAVGNKIYPLVVAVSAITTFTTPYLIRFSGYVSEVAETKLPDRVKFFLKKYTHWVYRAQAAAKGNPAVKVVCISILTNGIIVAAIFTIADQVIFPMVPYLATETWSANSLSMFIAMIAASPFIWGMLFAYKKLQLPEDRKPYLYPAVIIIWAITFTEIAILSLIEFNSGLTLALFLTLAIVFFVFLYRQLEKSYVWFERQLVENVNGNQPGAEDDLAPWNMHLVKLRVHENAEYADKMLSELNVWNKYKLCIIAIVRASKLISMPADREIIQADDRLIVFGSDKNIDDFKAKIRHHTHAIPKKDYLDRFSIKSIHVNMDSQFLGKTIAQLHLDETIHGLIAGIERDGERMPYPAEQTKIEEGDLLLIVGEADKMQLLTDPKT